MQVTREKQTRETDQYDKLIARADELRKQAEEAKTESTEATTEKLPLRTFITGMATGEVHDINIKEHRNRLSRSDAKYTIIMDLKLRTGDFVTVTVNDTGEYEEENDLVRLLESEGIQDYRIDALIGKQIRIIHENGEPIFTQYHSPDELDWDVFIPKKLDIPGQIAHSGELWFRRTGNQILSEVIRDEETPFEDRAFFLALLSTLGMFTWFMYAIVTTMIFGGLGFLIAGVLTLFTPFFLRYMHSSWSRYKTHRSQDSLLR